jgi:hypothetical protein
MAGDQVSQSYNVGTYPRTFNILSFIHSFLPFTAAVAVTPRVVLDSNVLLCLCRCAGLNNSLTKEDKRQHYIVVAFYYYFWM